MNIAEIARFAPSIAGALGGPGAAIIAALVSHAFGAKNDLSDLPDLMAGNPDKVAEVESKLANLQAINVAADDADKGSARKMQVDMHSYMPMVLTIVNAIGFFSAVFISYFKPVDASDQTIINILIGVLASSYASNNQFYTGATHHSLSQLEKSQG